MVTANVFYDGDKVVSHRFGPGVVTQWCHDNWYIIEVPNSTGKGTTEIMQEGREMDLDRVSSSK